MQFAVVQTWWRWWPHRTTLAVLSAPLGWSPHAALLISLTFPLPFLALQPSNQPAPTGIFSTDITGLCFFSFFSLLDMITGALFYCRLTLLKCIIRVQYPAWKTTRCSIHNSKMYVMASKKGDSERMHAHTQHLQYTHVLIFIYVFATGNTHRLWHGAVLPFTVVVPWCDEVNVL